LKVLFEITEPVATKGRKKKKIVFEVLIFLNYKSGFSLMFLKI